MKVPWFKHADPSVKRKSGFLIPSVRQLQMISGHFVETPYYFALAPNYDFTLSARCTRRKRGILWSRAHWRHRTANGRYDHRHGRHQAKLIPRPGHFTTTSNEGFSRLRSSHKGEFALNQYWQLGLGRYGVETDDTFRRFYNIDNILTTDRVISASTMLPASVAAIISPRALYQFRGADITTDYCNVGIVGASGHRLQLHFQRSGNGR